MFCFEKKYEEIINFAIIIYLKWGKRCLCIIIWSESSFTKIDQLWTWLLSFTSMKNEVQVQTTCVWLNLIMKGGTSTYIIVIYQNTGHPNDCWKLFKLSWMQVLLCKLQLWKRQQLRMCPCVVTWIFILDVNPNCLS